MRADNLLGESCIHTDLRRQLPSESGPRAFPPLTALRLKLEQDPVRIRHARQFSTWSVCWRVEL